MNGLRKLLMRMPWRRGVLASWRSTHSAPGPRGERAAAKHLKRRGYRILARNLRSRLGEVDLLAEAPDGRTIVVVEVKAGIGRDAYAAEARVGPDKQRKLVALAAQLARRHGLEDRPIRFDVIGVGLDPAGRAPPAIRHYEAAFESHL